MVLIVLLLVSSQDIVEFVAVVGVGHHGIGQPDRHRFHASHRRWFGAFGNEPEGAHVHTIAHQLRVLVSRDHHTGNFRAQSAKVRQGFKPVEARHADVQHDHVKWKTRTRKQRSGGLRAVALHGLGLGPEQLELHHQPHPEHGVVVDQQDAHSAPSNPHQRNG